MYVDDDNGDDDDDDYDDDEFDDNNITNNSDNGNDDTDKNLNRACIPPKIYNVSNYISTVFVLRRPFFSSQSLNDKQWETIWSNVHTKELVSPAAVRLRHRSITE